MKIYNEPIKKHRTYTKEVKEIQSEVAETLEPLFHKYIKLGYKPNEIYFMMCMSITDLTLDETLGLNK